ncbi:MAG: hypothetical protein M0C28_47460 [Candidatus Moduliflexus flocculans]|nr:hypothetical protein [Candidatus Moduliflexus flocculans]
MGKMTRPRKRSRYSPGREPGRTRPPFSSREIGDVLGLEDVEQGRPGVRGRSRS